MYVNSVILFNMGVGVQFVSAESDTGRELRSAIELGSRYEFYASQCIHPMFGKLRMKVEKDL